MAGMLVKNAVTVRVGSLVKCQEQIVEASKIVIGSTVSVPFLQHKPFNATEVSLVLLLCQNFADLHFKIDGGNWAALMHGRFTHEEITACTH
jgi:hypothetical protein